MTIINKSISKRIFDYSNCYLIYSALEAHLRYVFREHIGGVFFLYNNKKYDIMTNNMVWIFMVNY